jgi:hypothetical protein
MTALLRTTFLAALAISSVAGSALADQTIPSCAKISINDLWSGRCCSADSDCLGGGRGGRDHNDNGGRGGRGGNGGTAGKN